jgi:hypothetical protein
VHRVAPAAGAAAGQQRGGSSVVAAAPVAGATDHSPPGAGNRPTQKEPFRATIFRRRGLGISPLSWSGSEGRFCAFVPRAGTGGHSLRQTIRSPCRIRCPLPVPDPVVYVGGPVRGTGGGYVTPAAGSAGAHRGAKLGCVFAKGAKSRSVICKRN